MVKSICLKNDKLIVEINTFGAELARIYDRENQREILWDADPAVWKRHAPVLFPFVGQCFNQVFRYEDKEYKMSQHGFARDCNFELISDDEQEVWYRLTDSEETRIMYPFSFHLEIGYRLAGGRITVMWRIRNTSAQKTLYFTIGGHPAFRVPETIVGDMKLLFPGQEHLKYEPLLESGFVAGGYENILILAREMVSLNKNFYQVPTYIFHRCQVDRVKLLLPDETPYLTLDCQGFPYLGVWSPDPERFVCLEPWFGRCDDEGFDGAIDKKNGILSLKPEGVFEASYYIEIH